MAEGTGRVFQRNSMGVLEHHEVNENVLLAHLSPDSIISEVRKALAMEFVAIGISPRANYSTLSNALLLDPPSFSRISSRIKVALHDKKISVPLCVLLGINHDVTEESRLVAALVNDIKLVFLLSMINFANMQATPAPATRELYKQLIYSLFTPPFVINCECEVRMDDTQGSQRLPVGKYDMVVSSTYKANQKVAFNYNGDEEGNPILGITEKTDDSIAVTLPITNPFKFPRKHTEMKSNQ